MKFTKSDIVTHHSGIVTHQVKFVIKLTLLLNTEVAFCLGRQKLDQLQSKTCDQSMMSHLFV